MPIKLRAAQTLLKLCRVDPALLGLRHLIMYDGRVAPEQRVALGHGRCGEKDQAKKWGTAKQPPACLAQRRDWATVAGKRREKLAAIISFRTFQT